MSKEIFQVKIGDHTAKIENKDIPDAMRDIFMQASQEDQFQMILQINEQKEREAEDLKKREAEALVAKENKIKMISHFTVKAPTPEGDNEIRIHPETLFYKLKNGKRIEYKVAGAGQRAGDKITRVGFRETRDPGAKLETMPISKFTEGVASGNITFPLTDEEYKKIAKPKKPKDAKITRGNAPAAINPAERGRNETIKNIGDLLRLGVDRVVIHGKTVLNEEGDPALMISPDTDTLGALYLLNNSFDPNKKPNIHYKNQKEIQNSLGSKNKPTPEHNKGEMVEETITDPNTGKDVDISYIPGPSTEIIPKGVEDSSAQKGIVLYIDVGSRELSVEQNGVLTKIFIDHHGPEKGPQHTSATALMYEILTGNGMLKEKPVWIDKFTGFMNNVDNLSYVDERGKDKKKVFTRDYFTKTWPNTLQGIYERIPFQAKPKGKVTYESIPFKTLVSIFEKYPRDPMAPFTKEELEGELGKTVVLEKEVADETDPTKKKLVRMTLAEACEKLKDRAEKTVFNVSRAIDSQKERGIGDKNDTLGKFVYHDFSTYKRNGGKDQLIMIDHKMGFLGVKALGYDTYTVFNKQRKNFIVNSTTRDLTKIHKEIQKIVPGTKKIRGVFIFPPVGYEKMKETLTEAEFRKCLDIAPADPTKNSPEPTPTPEPIPVIDPKEKDPVPEEEPVEYTREELEERIEKFEGNPTVQNIFREMLGKFEKEEEKDSAPENKKGDPKKKEEKKEKKGKEAVKVSDAEVKKLASEFEKSRFKYITEYKAALEAKKGNNWFSKKYNKVKDFFVGSKLAESDTSEDLKKNKTEWEAASEKYQKLLQNKYRAEHIAEGGTEEEADRYARGKVLNEVVLKNIYTNREVEAEKWPPEKKNLAERWWEKWRTMPQSQKILVSSAIFALAGLTGGMAVGAIATGVGLKVGRSAATGLISGHITKRSYAKDEKKKVESIKALQSEFMDGDMDAKTYQKKYEEIVEKEKKANKKRLLTKAGIALAVGAGTAAFTEIYDSLHAVGTPGTGTENGIPGPKGPIGEPTPGHGGHYSDDAIIRKNEGIEHAFRRQIEHDPALKKYFAGTNSGAAAHQAALKLGYVNGHGAEVRVGMPGVGYRLEVDSNGALISHEVNANGASLDTDHHEGDSFESIPDKHEYAYNRQSPHDVLRQSGGTNQAAEAKIGAGTTTETHTDNTNIDGTSAADVHTGSEVHDGDDNSGGAIDGTDNPTTDHEAKLNMLPFDDQVKIRIRTDLDTYFSKNSGLVTTPGPDTAIWQDLSKTDSWDFMKTLTAPGKGYSDNQVHNFGEYFHVLAERYNFMDEKALKGKTVGELFTKFESNAQSEGFTWKGNN